MVCKSNNERNQRASKLIFASDFLKNGVCRQGIIKWHKKNNLPLREFLRNGYTIEFLEKFNNPHINRVIEKVR